MSIASAAFLKLVDYAARCRQHAFQLPSRQDVVQYWSGVGFLLDGQLYVAPMDQVSEILSVPSYTRVPGVHVWMKGIANVRGRLMAVMDLSGYLDKTAGIQEKKRRLLVIDHGDLYTGVTVDDVYGIQRFPVTGFVADPDGVDQGIKPYILGAYEKDGDFWQVFSIEHLAEDPRFLQVAR